MTFLPVIEVGAITQLVLKIKLGNPIDLFFEYQDPDGTPKDMRGKTFLAQIRSSPKGTLMATFEIITDELEIGVVHLHIDTELGRTIRRGVWEYEVDGEAEIGGPVEIDEEVSYAG